MVDALPNVRIRDLTRRSLLLALSAICLLGSGCGSSSKQSSKASTTPAASRPLTKAQYERKLGPLLNDVVDPALRAAFRGGRPTQKGLGAAVTVMRLAHDQMAAVTPPAAISTLHRQAVKLLSSMVDALTKLRTALIKGDKSAQSSASAALVLDAQHMQTLGNEFTSRGY